MLNWIELTPKNTLVTEYIRTGALFYSPYTSNKGINILDFGVMAVYNNQIQITKVYFSFSADVEPARPQRGAGYKT